ncbi:hypothetical protein HYDPIDRAFT_29769 [Hydnomerulius pinastri MD-312]|uniref:F-box domain-containing protein n=1 Tax=Hydnomerulius pinastri MD-312 TaxID=994086 RepID=A0A0C9WE64_9AGAM|nr:hypothetical protein HYDPIDRAFT_29769 [Hydnomerulius pinastri MD-312]
MNWDDIADVCFPKKAHRCFSIAEILGEIFSFIYDKKTLARAARTCHSFKDPALNALYKEVDSLNDLFSCLSADLYAMADREMILRRPMTPGDVGVLQSYAVRVKTLTVRDEAPAPKIHVNIIHSLCLLQRSPNALLTPNLHTLAWISSSEHYVPLLPFFISSRLETFTVVAHSSPGHWLPTITSLCPSLRHLTLHGPNFLRATPVPLRLDLTCIRDWTQLEVLSCGTLTQQVFEYALSNLTSLAFSITKNDEWVTKIKTMPSPFTSLTSLEVCSHNVDQLSHLLKRVHLPGVTELNVYVVTPGSDGAAFARFFESVSQCCSPSSLRDLGVTIHGDFIDHIPKAHCNIDEFRPLFKFRNLQTLRMDAVSFAVDNSELEELSLAFPSIEDMDMWTCTPPVTPKNTLEGLIPLLKNCPKLRSLAFSLDATSVSISPGRPGGGVQNTHIDVLALSNSPIADEREVAVFLSDILPNVERIDSDHVSDSNEEKWAEVGRWLPFFAKARRQEHESNVVS